MKIFKPPYLLLFLFFGSLATAQDQEPSEIFDEIIGLENTDLASGTEYIEHHITRNNRHKFFQNDSFEKGNVTYGGQRYVNILMKYNVFDDQLLIRLPQSGGENIFKLHKEHIESFSLYGHNFRNLRSPEGEESEIGGFYEVLHQGSSGQLLKKHVKKSLKHLDRNFTYYEFEPDEPQYIFFRNNIYYPFNSRRNLYKLFPGSEKMIRRYYRSNRSLSRSDHDQFLIQLFRNLQDSAASN